VEIKLVATIGVFRTGHAPVDHRPVGVSTPFSSPLLYLPRKVGCEIDDSRRRRWRPRQD